MFWDTHSVFWGKQAIFPLVRGPCSIQYLEDCSSKRCFGTSVTIISSMGNSHPRGAYKTPDCPGERKKKFFFFLSTLQHIYGSSQAGDQLRAAAAATLGP